MCAAANDFAGAKQTAEKHRFRCENDEKHTSVALATEVCFSSFSHRNRCFSAVCLAPAKSFAAAHMQDGKEGRNPMSEATGKTIPPEKLVRVTFLREGKTVESEFNRFALGEKGDAHQLL